MSLPPAFELTPKQVYTTFLKNAENHEIESFTLGDLLGKGAFGQVVSVTVEDPCPPAAMKMISVTREMMRDGLRGIGREVKILKQITEKKIPHVVRFFGEFLDGLTQCLVMERVDGGTMTEFLQEYGPAVPEYCVRSFATELLEGIRGLHYHNIVHRDIKPDNLLLTSNQRHIKIADFGFAKVVDPETGRARTLCGTSPYMAPELHEPFAWTYNGYSADVFSYGATVLEMLTGKRPWDTSKIDQLPRTRAARTFLRGLLERDPVRRQKVADIRLHPWIQDACPKGQEERKSDTSIESGGYDLPTRSASSMSV